MADRNGGSAQSTDNSVAESLADEDFFFEGEDGKLIGPAEEGENDGGEPTEEEISEGTETETQEEQEEEEGQEADGSEEPAGKPVAKAPQVTPAGNEQQPPAPTPTPQAPASDAEQYQPTPTFHETVRANWPAAVDQVVAAGAFRLSPEEAEILDPAAAKIIERKASEVYLQALTTMSQMLHTTLPAVVHSLSQIKDDGQQAEQRFYQTYGFDGAKHKQQLTQIGQFVKMSNPSLKGQAYADEVARMGYAMLGVTPPAKKPNGQNGAKQPAAAKPGARVVATKSFTPAAKSGGGGQPQNRRAPGQPVKKPEAVFDLNAMLRSNIDMDD